MAYQKREKDQVVDKPPFKDVSFNRKLKQSSSGSFIDPLVVPATLRKRADEYFDETAYPTFTGLALALGFPSVRAWESAMSDHATYVAKHGAEIAKEHAARLFVWDFARSRVQLHYEEGIQSQEIPAQVGKFVLEVLGFQPAQVSDVQTSGAQAAAEAVRQGFAAGAAAMAKGKGAGAVFADDVAAAGDPRKKWM